jgi:DNA-binding NtrC family response regulator
VNQPPKVILVVDDDVNVREGLQRVLEREGYTVHCAENADQALVLLRQQPVQLVISDYGMSGMNGVEFLKLVRARHPHVCRIMLTGTNSLDVAVRSINDGEVYRLALKPWDNAALRETVFFAFEELGLRAENRRVVAALRRQAEFIHSLERQFPGIQQAPDADLAALLASSSPEGSAGPDA